MHNIYMRYSASKTRLIIGVRDASSDDNSFLILALLLIYSLSLLSISFVYQYFLYL